jgi:hypothetical protein
MPSDPSDLKVFAAPVLRGGRFDDHTIPVDVLPQFEVYQSLVRALAEVLYRKRNKRIRVPPRFAAAFQLKLQKVEGDCAVPVLARPESSEMSEGSRFGTYYDEARDLIATTIQALGKSEPLPDDFPEELLEDLLKLGRYLADDEALELRGPNRTPGPVYNAMTRLLLEQRLARRSYRKVAELSGTVVGFDWDSEWFRLLTLEGHYVTGRHTSSTGHKLLKALTQKIFVRVAVLGEVTFTPDHIPEKIGSLQDARFWTGSDEASVRQLEERIKQLQDLMPGWHEGKYGRALASDGLTWLAELLTRLMVERYLPKPRLAAGPEDEVEVEWSFGAWEVSATINLEAKRAYMHAAHIETLQDDDKNLELDTPEGIESLVTFVRKYGKFGPEVA